MIRDRNLGDKCRSAVNVFRQFLNFGSGFQ